MILQEDYSDEDDKENQPTEGIKDETTMELSMSSIVGLMGNDTMKLKARLLGEEVVILIDSGATHNFIYTETIHRLDIPTTAQ